LSPAVLKISGLSKLLESAGAQFELRVPELSFERGKFYGVVGRSGSGKSTMLDLLAMVAKPTSVEQYQLHAPDGSLDLARIVLADDDKAISAARLNHFGYVLQTGGLFSFLTIEENLLLPFALSDRPVDEEHLARLVALYDMGDHLHKKPSALSGGQRQRVSILRALCLKPTIVLADEPTASVDENLADLIVAELKRLAAEHGVTVVMVSHDLELVKQFADAIVTMRAEVVRDGVVRTIVGKPELVA
jgi:putative ABC transport system ATP-binding protein